MAFYNTSKFHMWRGCFAAIWIDGVISTEEREWAMQKINTLQFTKEQKETLLGDLATRADLKTILSEITDKKDKAFLAYQIRIIAQLDNDYSKEEKAMYETWNEIVLKGLDMDALEAIIAADEKASYHEDEVYKVDNKNSAFEKMFRSAQKLANPGDYKFPDQE